MQKNKKAEFFSIQAKNLSYQSKRVDYIAIALIRYGIVFNKREHIQKGLEMIHFLKDNQLEKSIREEIKDFSNYSF